jgi:hypothetical protein
MKEMSPDTQSRIRGEITVNNVLKIKKNWDSRGQIRNAKTKGN